MVTHLRFNVYCDVPQIRHSADPLLTLSRTRHRENSKTQLLSYLQTLRCQTELTRLLIRTDITKIISGRAVEYSNVMRSLIFHQKMKGKMIKN